MGLYLHVCLTIYKYVKTGDSYRSKLGVNAWRWEFVAQTTWSCVWFRGLDQMSFDLI